MSSNSSAPADVIHDTGAGLLGTVLPIGRFLIVLSLFTVSPFALVALDWQYFDTGGTIFDKFHPATLIAFALVAMSMLAGRNPLTAAITYTERHAALVPFVLAIFFAVFYASRLQGQSITIFLETFLGAVAMLLAFQQIEERERRRLALLIHFLMFCNAMLAIYEVATDFRLTPLVVNGELLHEPRATALLGHPLANAMIEEIYVVAIAVGGARDLPTPLRTVAFLAALASLVPFGGRVAIASCLLTLAVILVVRFGMILRGDRFRTTSLLWAFVLIPTFGFAFVMAYEQGWLDTLLNRLVDDQGSAETRIVMFELFHHFSFEELFFGPDPAMLDTWVRLYGLEYGIESFIVAYVLHYGLLSALVVMPTFFLFLYQVRAATNNPRTWYLLFNLVVVSLGSVSLSAKSPALSIFVVMTIVLMSTCKDAPTRDMADRVG